MSISDYINIKDFTTQVAILAITVVGGFLSYYFGFRKPSDSNTLLEIHKESLENAVKAKGLELELAQEKKDKKRIQAELDELKNRQANPEQSLKAEKTFITKIKKILEDMLKSIIDLDDNEVLVGKLAIAKADIEKGSFSKTDDFFAEIEIDEGMDLDGSVRLALVRAEIAEHEVRWNDAVEHCARAVKLNPCFDTLIRAQKLAIDVGTYDSALSFGLAAQKAAIKEHGEDSEQYATSLNNLAGVYLIKKQYKKAEWTFKEALKIRENIFEKKHPKVAVSLNNLGGIYLEQKQYREAIYFFKKALNINKEVVGIKHSSTATTLNNIGGSYRALGEFKKAEPRLKQALNIRKEILGDNHPDTANSYNNLGGLYSQQGQYKKAESYCRQAVKIIENAFGPDHPDSKLFRKNYESVKERLDDTENTTPQ